MKKFSKELLVKYLICFGVASVIVLAVYLIGYFSLGEDDVLINLTDGFSVAGLAMLMFAGVLFISGEGGFLGIGFVMRNIVLAFTPMGRLKHETFAQYRERKLEGEKKPVEHCVWITGLAFLLVGIVLAVVFYARIYGASA